MPEHDEKPLLKALELKRQQQEDYYKAVAGNLNRGEMNVIESAAFGKVALKYRDKISIEFK